MHIIESTWSKILSILKKNGLGIDEIKDAEPIEEYREFFSIEYWYLHNNVHFICVRAVRNL